MAQINKLTQLAITKHSKRMGKYADGGGLYLLVRRPGDCSWCFRYMVNGQARQLGLGPLHSVSLTEARNRARQARQVILDGRDPIEAKQAASVAAKVEQAHNKTFAEVVAEFLSSPKVETFRNVKHKQQWASTLATACKSFGDVPLRQIDSAMVLDCLRPVLAKTPETGTRLRQRVERVFEWSRPLHYFEGANPASRELLQDHLPAKKAGHHAALAVAELPALMATLRDRDSVSARALEFTILTVARTNETLGARWEEIDLVNKLWIIPGERMKAGKEHRVALSHRACEILKTQPRLGEHVFINGGGKVLSNQAMSEMLKGLVGSATVHGMRSVFKDWCHDHTSFDHDTIERAMAHAVANKVEKAYRRSDALAKRARLMEAWSRFCESGDGTAGATVLPMRAGRMT